MTNPFEAPADAVPLPLRETSLGRDFAVGDVFRIALDRCAGNWPILIASLLAISLVFTVWIGALTTWSIVGGHAPTSPEYQQVTLVSSLGFQVLLPLATIGALRLTIEVARGARPGFEVLIPDLQGYLSMVGIGVLIGGPALVVQAGQYFAPSALWALPNLLYVVSLNTFFAFGGLYAHLLVVDRRLSPIDALKTSWAACEGHRRQPFLLSLGLMGLMFVGMIPCGLGLFVAMPVGYVAVAVAYLATFPPER